MIVLKVLELCLDAIILAILLYAVVKLIFIVGAWVEKVAHPEEEARKKEIAAIERRLDMVRINMEVAESTLTKEMWQREEMRYEQRLSELRGDGARAPDSQGPNQKRPA